MDKQILMVLPAIMILVISYLISLGIHHMSATPVYVFGFEVKYIALISAGIMTIICFYIIVICCIELLRIR